MLIGFVFVLFHANKLPWILHIPVNYFPAYDSDGTPSHISSKTDFITFTFTGWSSWMLCKRTQMVQVPSVTLQGDSRGLISSSGSAPWAEGPQHSSSPICFSFPIFKMATGILALGKPFEVCRKKASNNIFLFFSVAYVSVYFNKFTFNLSSSDELDVQLQLVSRHFN